MSIAANRYAKALIDVLHAEGIAENGLADLERFSQILKGQVDAARALGNPTIPAVRRQELLKTLGDALELNARTRNFLGLLVERNRLDLLGTIIVAYRKMMDERLGIVRATVTSAFPMDAAKQAEVAQQLQQATGKRVLVTTAVDPSLIGGVVAQVGSTIYDGSIRQQLAAFRNRLANIS